MTKMRLPWQPGFFVDPHQHLVDWRLYRICPLRERLRVPRTRLRLPLHARLNAHLYERQQLRLQRMGR